MTIGVCPTAVVGWQTTPSVKVVAVGSALGVKERVGTGVGVSETIGVGVETGAAVGVLEHAESAPTATSAIAAMYIPRFTGKPFRSDFEL